MCWHYVTTTACVYVWEREERLVGVVGSEEIQNNV